MPHDHGLRPIERCVLRMAEEGVDDAEIGRRLRHSAEWVARVRTLARIPRHGGVRLQGDVLRPLERRVLRWRASGAGYDDMSPRFRRSPDFLRRVEALAGYKLRPPGTDGR